MTRPRGRKVAVALLLLAIALGLAAAGAPRFVRTLWPQVAVDAAFNRDFDALVGKIGQNLFAGPKDPWGNPWKDRTVEPGELTALRGGRNSPFVFAIELKVMTVYSAGPDGHDQRGDGDDLYPSTRARAAAWVPAAYAPEILGSLAAVALAWALLVGRLRKGLARNLVALALMAALPSGLAGWAVHWAEKTRATKDLVPASPLAVLPVSLVAVGSVAVLATLLALALRLVGKSEATAADEPSSAPSRATPA